MISGTKTGTGRRTAAALATGAVLALLLAGCGGEHGAAPAARQTGGQAAAQPAAGAASTAGADTTGAPTAAPPETPLRPGEGQFILLTVNGKKPPVTIGRQAGCDAQLIAGSLRIDSGQFIFREAVQRVCNGKPTGQATYKAQGTARVDGPTVSLKTSSGSAFTTARGSLNDADHMITLRQLDTPAGRKSVSWAFQRR